MSKLRKIRLNKRITQVELSKLSGVSQQYISDIENGISSGSISAIKKLSKALGVPMSKLMDEETS